MYGALWLAAILTGFLAVWGLYFAIIDRAVIFKQLIVAGVVEVLMLVIAVAMAVQQIGGYAVKDGITLWGYLLTCLILLPIGGAWALIDRTRTSSIALVILSISLVVCQWRLWQVWTV